MAKYKFQGPDGVTHLFEGPKGLSQQDVDLFGRNYFGVEPEFKPVAPIQPKGESGFIPSIMRGGRGLASLATDIAPAMVGKAFGNEEYANKQLKEAAEYQKETERLYPAEIASYKDIKGIGDALTYVKESVGEAIPSMIPSLFTGGAAGIAARPAMAAAEKAATEVAKRELMKESAQAAIKSGAYGAQQEALNAIKGVAMEAGAKAAQKVALKYEAAGALAGSALQNIPDVYQNIYEATGKQDLGAALAFGSFNAALDAITPINLLRKASKAGIGPQELAAAWYKRAGKGAVEGLVTEGGTEALQEISSAAAEKFVDQNQQFFTQKNFERFVNAGLKGGLGGAGITSATNVAFGKGPEAPKEKRLADFMAPPVPEAPETLAPEQVATTEQQVTPSIEGFEVAPEGTQVDETAPVTVEGAADVGQPNAPAGGESAVLASTTGTGTPTEGLGEPTSAGVVPTGENVPSVVEGKEQQPSSLEKDINQAADLIAAGADSATLSKYFSPEVIAEAVKRVTQSTPEEAVQETTPTEEGADLGTETTEAVQAETQGQEEPTAPTVTEETAPAVEAPAPAPEVSQDIVDEFDASRDYHNQLPENEARKVPAFAELTPEQQAAVVEATKDGSAASFDAAVAQIADATHGAPKKKRAPVPAHVEKQLDLGNIKALINYLKSAAKNPLYREIAKRIDKFKFSTKIEAVKSLPNGRIAEYDPKADVIRVTEEGIDEDVLMHELIHAATIRILHGWNNETTKLSGSQQDAAAHLEYLMDESEAALSEKFPEAYKDLYEFVSHALTDAAFQKELKAIPISAKNSLVSQDSSAWSNFMKAIAQLIDLIAGKSNFAAEVATAFERVLSVPTGGIEMRPLPAPKKGAVVKQAPAGVSPSQQTPEQITQAALGQVKLREHGGKAFFKNLFTRRGYEAAVRYLQDERRPLLTAERVAARFGILKSVGDGLNNVYGQITRGSGIAVDMFSRHMKFPTEDVHKAIEGYATKRGIDVKEALSELHLIMQARHEPERRAVKYMMTVPLENDSKRIKFMGKNFSAEGFREEVLRILAQPTPGLTDQQRTARAQQLRQLMDQVVADPSMHAKVTKTLSKKGKVTTTATTPEMFDIGNERYNVIAGRGPAEIAAIRKTLDTVANRAEIDAVSNAIKEVHKQTTALNKYANYWSQPVSNIVDFYGFQNYVPFKGRPGSTQIDEEFNIDTKRIGGELQDGQDAFHGRLSESENPILQSLADGASAAMRAGRKDLTLAIKNSVNPKARVLFGGIKGTIKFEDRFLGDTSKKDLGGENKVFHYNADGTIDIIEIHDKKQIEAIRRSYRETQPLVDMVNHLTSGIGQTHTRYNPAFAPMNFVRDALTNAFTIGAELGPVKAGRLLTGIAQEVGSGGMAKALKFSNMYAHGEFAKIDQMAGGTKAYENLTPDERYYRDLSDYVKAGGRVSYLQGVAAKGALDELVKEVGRHGILRKKDQIDKFIDIYNDMFELSSRVASYRLLKEEFRADNIAKGMKPAEATADANVRAVEYAKNLANFEQVGRWGKQAGALFMFFRPAATGAVRAIDALAPAFGFNEAEFRKEAEAHKRTPEQINKAVAEMYAQQEHARRMAMTLVGMGVAMYVMAAMLAGEDDQGRNRVATDDMARWTRYARFFIPGMENPIQIPWGFGMGSFAAAGAQLASIGSGRVSVADALSNVATVGLDSFLPIPVSRINPLDNFPAWAMDSITPSAFRPFFEYVMNLDGLGREIYNNRQTRYGDAYTGGDNIPEMYKGVARMLFNATNGAVDWSPNTINFFASNYVDGLAKTASSAVNIGLTVSGQKDFDPKNDLIFLSSFVGSKSNVDAREFSAVENKIKALDKRINSLKDNPEAFSKFLETHENEYAMVDFYNKQVNGKLRQIRTAANQVRANKDMTIKERKTELEELNKLSNYTKRELLDVFAEYGIKP